MSARKSAKRCSKALSRWCSTKPRTGSTRRSRSSYGASASSRGLPSIGFPHHHIGAMTKEIDSGAETGFDRLLQFTLPDRHARGRIVRLGPALEEILAAHPYPPVLKHLLSEALVVTALMGALLKDEGSQLTLQAQADGGVVSLLVCDYRGGELRGYARHDEERLAELGASPALQELFGGGYLAITFDLALTDQRYQGIVPLEGTSLSRAVERYFVKSEQVPT